MTHTNTTRRQLLQSFLAGTLLAAPAAPRPRRPNVVFYFPDQMRGQDMGCMGNREVRTPNLDRFASEGLHFRNTLANSPVCCPARAILMTGQYCHKNGMVANDLRLHESHLTIAEVLREQGYRTGYVGKWHLDGGPRMPGYVPPGPRRQGFEFWAANECSHRHFDTQYFRDAAVPIPIKRFEVDAWTDLGLEFLEASRKDDRPFFLMISLGPPHDPYGAPDEYMKMYDPDKLTLRPNWKQAERVPGRKELAAYYAAITSVDHHFGRLLKTLDEFGMAEDTIVLFASDHGDMLGSQGLRLKRKPWEESILVPGILRYPRKVRPGRSSDALFSHIDLPPTLLSLCGAPVPSAMQGADLSAHILGGSGQPPDSAFFQIFGPFQGGGVTEGWRGVRTGRYMYARHQSKPWVLYDLQKDPYELENLINDPAAASILQDMDKRLQAWMNQTGDSWSFNWTHPVEDNGRLYRHLTFCSVHEYLAWAKEHEKESLR